MDLRDLVPLLGFSDVHPELVVLLQAAAPGILPVSRRKLRAQGMVGVELKARGLALTFEEREGYDRTTKPARSDGEAILAGIFAYGPGSRNYVSYAGPVPFSQGPVNSREDALRAFGPPARTEVDEDDGSIDWDQWIKDGIQVRTSYRSDGSFKVLSFSHPFRQSA